MEGVETDTLIKFLRLNPAASRVTTNCASGALDRNFKGLEVLRSFAPPRDGANGNEARGQFTDSNLAFDYGQVMGLDLCNKNSTRCKSRISAANADQPRPSIPIPGSWNVFPSVYDRASDQYGFLWTTFQVPTAAVDTFFVVPKVRFFPLNL